MFSPVLIKGALQEGKDDGRIIQPMMWGLIPPWHKGEAKSHGLSTNNARIEGLPESKLYKRPLTQKKVCVILAQGFYEWKTVEAKAKVPKQPYFIYMPQNDESLKIYDSETWTNGKWDEEKGWEGPRILMMAGLYDTWNSPEGEVVYSYTVITMESNSTLSWLHDRMPAILETPEQVQAWLSASPTTSTHELLAILKPAQKLEYYAVSTKVNNSRCRDVDCMNPLQEAKSKGKSFMENWLKKPGGSKKTARDEDAPPKDEHESEDNPSKKPKVEKS